MKCLGLSIHISSFKFFVYFTRKNLLFLFYTSTFTKHPHQFIYSPHLFNKIFIILQFFIIHSLTAPLSHRPTATITTIIRNQKPLNQKSISRQANQNSIRTHPISIQKSKKNQHQINQHRSTHTKKNQRRSKRHHLHASTPPHIPRSTHNPNQPRPSKLTQTKTNPHHKLRLNHHRDLPTLPPSRPHQTPRVDLATL